MITEAWSPLGRGRELLDEPVITDIATRLEATPAQVVLAWHMARGVVPIPKSSSLERQVSNFEAQNLELTSEEVAAITSLGINGHRVLDIEPATHEEF
ncbi:MAG: aldo/keto reductase [Scrofimicrobium sp.]